VVVTRGAAGATCWAGEEKFKQNAVPVTAVDTVGAGDAFAAGYLTSRRLGRPVSERLATGARVAAFAVATSGDWEGLPTRADVALLDIEDGGSLR
jgi:2-dehydro-3-deoxygluconokinase